MIVFFSITLSSGFRKYSRISIQSRHSLGSPIFFHAKGNRCAGNPLQNLNVRFISFPTPLPSFLFCLFVFLYCCSTIILSLFLSSFFLLKYGVSVIFPQKVTRISNVKKDDTCKRFLPTEKFNVNFSTCSSAIKILFQVIYPYQLFIFFLF